MSNSHKKGKTAKPETEPSENIAAEPAEPVEPVEAVVADATPAAETPINTGTETQDTATATTATPAVGEDIDSVLAEAEKNSNIQAELDAAKDRYLRLMAEFDNYKRRTSKEYERLVESANEKLILEMIGVRENFHRALKAGESGGDFAPFFEGMKLIFAKFDETLANNGMSVFAEAGEEFDPAIHDALMNAPNAQIPADHIAEVFERGYRLKDKVIKHARVIVSSGAGG